MKDIVKVEVMCYFCEKKMVIREFKDVNDNKKLFDEQGEKTCPSCGNKFNDANCKISYYLHYIAESNL